MAYKSIKKQQNQGIQKVPLRHVLLIPFLLVILVAGWIAGYASYINGQAAVNDVARQLRSEISARIKDHLQHFLKVPHDANNLNTASVQQGWLHVNETETLQRYFLEQVKAHPTISSIYFGNTEGGIIGSGREGADGYLYIYNTENPTAGVFNKYAVTRTEERGELLFSTPNFDARVRPWYEGAVQNKGATWNDIYILFTGQDMAISASLPIYDEQNHLQGVVSVDIFVSQIQNFLQTLKISKSGQSFIMERSGLLVASSTTEKPFIENNGKMERIEARNSQTPIVRDAAEFLYERFGEDYAVTGEDQFDFKINGKRYFLNVSPVRDPYGIDWLIVVIIPESDFMAGIIKNNLITFFISLTALSISVAISYFIAQKIASRISNLNQAMQTFINHGESNSVLSNSRIHEIDELTVSFTTMKCQLSQTLGNLRAEIETRRQVEEALEKTHHNYETFFNSIDEFLFVLDEQGNMIHVNQTVTNRLGYSAKELLGQSVLMVHPPERQQEAGRIVGEMLAGTAEFCPVPLITKTGDQIPVETRVTAGFWNDKNAIFGVTKDISQIKLSEEKFSKAFHSNSVLMALSKLEDGEYIDVNEMFLQTLGFSRAEVIGKQSTNLELFADPNQRSLIVEKIQQDKMVRGVEVLVKTKNGAVRNGLFSADIIYLGKNQCLLTTLVDITEHKQAEKALRESEEKYRTVANFTYDWEAWHAPDGECLYISKSCERISGYTAEQFLADSKLVLKITHPEDLERVTEHFDTATSCCQGEDAQLDFRIITLSGEMRWVSHHCTTVYSQEGLCLGRRESNRDITSRKQAEEALRESERFARATVNSMTGEIAILDENGVIIDVNHAWSQLAQHNAPDPAAVCEGANYLAVCDSAYGNDAVYAKAIAEGIRGVIQGKQSEFSLEYHCCSSDPADKEHNWFNAKITRFTGDGPVRAVVAHENINTRKLAEDRIQQQNVYLSVLHEITLDLLNHRSMDDLLQIIVERAAFLLHAPYGELMMEKDGVLTTQALTQNQPFLIESQRPRKQEGLCWQAFDIKKPVIANDYAPNQDNHNFYLHHSICTTADFPILIRNQCIGVLGLRRSEPGHFFDQTQINNGILFTQLAALVLDRARLFSTLEHEIVERKQVEVELRNANQTLDIAHHALERSFEREQNLARTDAMTGIHNRRFIFELAEHEFNISMRYRQDFSMILFDIDYFKHINDTYGHLTGDHALKTITQIVLAEIRTADMFGRYGGDEFVILLPRTNTEEALQLAERIQIRVSDAAIHTEKGALCITISIGIAQITETAAPQPNITVSAGVETLFLCADQALYAAKQAGRNRTVVFKE
jgi:diguanylate cyclase (GGDEF)-like protein/PAS domain S-box-containing protein